MKSIICEIAGMFFISRKIAVQSLKLSYHNVNAVFTETAKGYTVTVEGANIDFYEIKEHYLYEVPKHL